MRRDKCLLDWTEDLREMVFLEHIGFGGRDRQVRLYYWDLRDGPDFHGWWVTPDFVGNHEFFLQASDDKALTPDAVAIGNWRSPNVEQLQLKRQLLLGFKVKDGDLVSAGADAATPICPDNIIRLKLSSMAWKQDGINHGRPCYSAYDVAPEEEKPKAATPESGTSTPLPPFVVLSIGLAVGALAVLAAQRWSS